MQSADDAAELRQQRGVDEPFSGSAVEWVLRKADESLDEIEENPPGGMVEDGLRMVLNEGSVEEG